MTTSGRQKVLSSPGLLPASAFPLTSPAFLPPEKKNQKTFKLILLAPMGIAVSRMNNILYLWSSLTSLPVHSTGFSLSPPPPAQQSNWTASWWGKNFSLHSNQHFLHRFCKPRQSFPWQPLCIIKWSPADGFQNNPHDVRIFSKMWNPKYYLILSGYYLMFATTDNFFMVYSSSPGRW